MPQVVEPIPETQEAAPNRIRWTRRQYRAMRDADILEGRYELIEGEIISKMGQNRPHVIVIVLLCEWLRQIFGGAFVQAQGPIQTSTNDTDFSEPEPDVAVTLQPATAYLERLPTPSDLVLVVEVSDTTLRFDRSTKAGLYARAGICEYWIVDIAGRQVLVHRRPAAEGYMEITAYNSDERIATLAQAETSVRVADLLPPVS